MDTNSLFLTDFLPNVSHLEQQQSNDSICVFCAQRIPPENLESGVTVNETHLKSICNLLRLSWSSFEPFLKSTIRKKLKAPTEDLPLTLNLCCDCESWVLYVVDLYEKLETARKKIIKILWDSDLVSGAAEDVIQSQVCSIAHRVLKQCVTPCLVKAEKLPDKEARLKCMGEAEGAPTEELAFRDEDQEIEEMVVEPDLPGMNELVQDTGDAELVPAEEEPGSSTRSTRPGRQAKKRAYTFMKNILQKSEKENVTNASREQEIKVEVQDEDWEISKADTHTDTAEPSRKRGRTLFRSPSKSKSDSGTRTACEPGKKTSPERHFIKRPLKRSTWLSHERARGLKIARKLKPDMFLMDQSSININCEICDAKFAYHRLLDLHKLEAHISEPDKNLLTFECDICGDHINQEAYRIVTDKDQQGFRYVTLENGQEHVHSNFTALCEFHVQRHYLNTPKPRDRSSRNQSKKGHAFSCQLCPYTFKTQNGYERHKMHHLSEKPHKCIICSDAFHTEMPLHTHLAKVHSIELQMMDRYSCRRCLQVYLSDDPDRSSGQLSSQDLSAFKNFVKEHLPCLTRPCLTQRQLKCRFCSEKFMTPYKLYSHEVKVHTQDYKYYCDQCGRPELTALTLYFHNRHVHSAEEQTFQCDKCPSTFKRKNYLDQHLKTHNAVKSFQCSQCEKSFFTKFHCQSHERLHSGERTFPCPTCGKMFNTKGAAKRHDLGVHITKKQRGPYRPRKKRPNALSSEVVVDAARENPDEAAKSVCEGEIAEAVQVDEAELAEACQEDDVTENITTPGNESQKN